MKVKELPQEDRPREKAKRYGIDSLSNIELLAIILGSGYKDNNVLQLAANLLSEIGGLKGLTNSTYYSFKKISGIKEAKALMLASIGTLYKRISVLKDEVDMRSIFDILESYRLNIETQSQEKVILIIKNSQKELVEKTLYIGTEDEVNISIKDIVREVYQNNGKSFYLVHTHPSGLAIPSKLDILTTKVVKEKTKKAGLKLIDHFVVGKDGYISIYDYMKL